MPDASKHTWAYRSRTEFGSAGDIAASSRTFALIEGEPLKFGIVFERRIGVGGVTAAAWPGGDALCHTPGLARAAPEPD